MIYQNYQIQTDLEEINNFSVNKWMQDFRTLLQGNRIRLGQYYDGLNTITKQGSVAGRPNYSVNVNMAKYITDVSTSYAFGQDVTYSTDNEQIKNVLEKIQNINKNCKAYDIDFNVGGDMSCYGIGYQMVLVREGNEPIEDRITLKALAPERTFYVVDNTILNNPICAVYFYDYKVKDTYKTKAYIYTDTDLHIFDGQQSSLQFVESIPHNMGSIPIIQCLNNDDAFGDFELVTDILDALSLSISNNTDDLQSIANAILCASGGQLNEEQIELINRYKTANLPVGSKMEWIIKNINPEANKQHLENLLKFLFQISQVPDLTDDAFGGTQSGVAMQYKLWGVNQLWSTKVKKYTSALYDRLKIFLHLLQYEIGTQIDLMNDIQIQFYKNLPADATEEYEMVKALKGTVSEKTLLNNISIVDDVESEIQQIDEEKEKDADTYGFNNNGVLDDNERLLAEEK